MFKKSTLNATERHLNKGRLLREEIKRTTIYSLKKKEKSSVLGHLTRTITPGSAGKTEADHQPLKSTYRFPPTLTSNYFTEVTPSSQHVPSGWNCLCRRRNSPAPWKHHRDLTVGQGKTLLSSGDCLLPFCPGENVSCVRT